MLFSVRSLLRKGIGAASRGRPKGDFAPLFEHVRDFPEKVALRDGLGAYSYGNVFVNAKGLAREIAGSLGGKIHERVVFMCSNDVNYVVALWAIWMSGQTAVPVSPHHPEKVLDYYVSDSNARLLLATSEHKEIMRKVSKNNGSNLLVIDESLPRRTPNESLDLGGSNSILPPEIYEYSDGLILYTSGTTGNPKGVVLPHRTLHHQTTTLLDAWKWSPNDVILHTLPLHHIHGTVNALFCPLHIGATTVMLPKFDAAQAWSYLLGEREEKISVFMAVPTIYSKLIEEYHKRKKDERGTKEYLRNNVRLMVSGSAPLPVPVHEKWYELTGHRLLERYGMTEIGMCLSNLYDSDREPGYVGLPLPGVSVRLAESTDGNYETLLECTNTNGTIDLTDKPNEDVKGELLVKGPNVFKEYYNKPDLTKKEFTRDGWFRTGDVCEYSSSKKKFKMLGRQSADIIKSGGYKLSALQIETTLLAHPDVVECAVLGLEDETWGERVAAVIVPGRGSGITSETLREWAREKLPKYSVPSVVKVVEDIPKNAMGKVNKKELRKNMF